MKHLRPVCALALCMTVMLASCRGKNDTGFIPKAPDYSDPAMWITGDEDSTGTGADVFYVVSTWEIDWKTPDSIVCHYADVWNPEHRAHMATEMNKVAAYMTPGNRFWAPYYRHATIDAYLTRDEATIYERTRLAMQDVRDAFDHFLQVRDPERPIIIAGFSQGGQAMVELLKYMDDDTYSKLVAAYVMGYKVTEEDMAESSHIRPALGAEDIGVAICYNTVKDIKYINPFINHRT